MAALPLEANSRKQTAYLLVTTAMHRHHSYSKLFHQAFLCVTYNFTGLLVHYNKIPATIVCYDIPVLRNPQVTVDNGFLPCSQGSINLKSRRLPKSKLNSA